MKEIKLTQGKVALIDDEDFDRVNSFKWFAVMHRSTFYARRIVKNNGIQKTIHMHRFIMNCPNDKQIDHIDGNGLNNIKSNLRTCTNNQNLCNRGMNKNNTSNYKGVNYFRRDKKWRARITINGCEKHLGLFDTKEDAAQAYNIAAERYHGEFAKLNEIKR